MLCHPEEDASPPRDLTIRMQRPCRRWERRCRTHRLCFPYSTEAFGTRKVPHAGFAAVHDDIISGVRYESEERPDCRPPACAFVRIGAGLGWYPRRHTCRPISELDETPVSLEDRELRLPRVFAPGPRIRLCGFPAQPLLPFCRKAGGPEPGGQAGLHAPFEWGAAEVVRPGGRLWLELRRDHVQPAVRA